MVPQWYREVINSYEGDEKLKPLLERLAIGAMWEGYTLNIGMLRYQGRIVIGDNAGIKKKIFQALHQSPKGGHSREQNT